MVCECVLHEQNLYIGAIEPRIITLYLCIYKVIMIDRSETPVDPLQRHLGALGDLRQRGLVAPEPYGAIPATVSNQSLSNRIAKET